MKDKIIRYKNLSKDKSEQKEITNLYTIFLMKMLEEFKHKEFLNILKQNNLIKSCYIVIRGENIDCGLKYRISLYGYSVFQLSNWIFNNLNSSFNEFLLNKGIKNSLEKVNIELRTGINFAILETLENTLMGERKMDTEFIILVIR
jgi:hypothetical protein